MTLKKVILVSKSKNVKKFLERASGAANQNSKKNRSLKILKRVRLR